MERLALMKWLLAASLVLLGCRSAEAGKRQELLDFLRDQYDLTASLVSELRRPEVTVDFSLFDIPVADPTTNTVDFVVVAGLYWKNHYVWPSQEGSDFENVTKLNIPARELWIPDIVVYNQVSAPEKLVDDSADQVVAYEDGSVFYLPQKRIRTSCDLTGLDSSEGARCTIKLGSWTHTGYEMDLRYQTSYGAREGIDLHDFFSGSKYEITYNNVTRNVMYYPCCPEPYPDVTYTIGIRKAGTGSSWFSVF